MPWGSYHKHLEVPVFGISSVTLEQITFYPVNMLSNGRLGESGKKVDWREVSLLNFPSATYIILLPLTQFLVGPSCGGQTFAAGAW